MKHGILQETPTTSLPSSPLYILYSLNPRRIKHNPNPSSNTLRRQIPSKLTPHHSITPMSPTNLPPVHPKLASILSTPTRPLCNVGNTLSEVELGGIFGVASLDFDEGGVVVLCAEATLVAEDGAVGVETDWLGSLLCHGVMSRCIGLRG